MEKKDWKYEDGELSRDDNWRQRFTHESVEYEYRVDPRLYIVITSWRGISFGATHWYCKIVTENVKIFVVSTGEEYHYTNSAFPEPERYGRHEIELTFILDKDIVEDDGHVRYEKGENCPDFDDTTLMLKRAHEEIKRIFGEGWEIHYHRNLFVCEKQPCPDKQKVYERYGVKLDG